MNIVRRCIPTANNRRKKNNVNNNKENLIYLLIMCIKNKWITNKQTNLLLIIIYIQQYPIYLEHHHVVYSIIIANRYYVLYMYTVKPATFTLSPADYLLQNMIAGVWVYVSRIHMWVNECIIVINKCYNIFYNNQTNMRYMVFPFVGLRLNNNKFFSHFFFHLLLLLYLIYDAFFDLFIYNFHLETVLRFLYRKKKQQQQHSCIQ